MNRDDVDGRALIEAVRAWVRAEYQFRLGPSAYQKPTDEWIVAAEDELRRLVTGQPELYRAAKILGCTSDDTPEHRAGSPALPDGPRTVDRERLSEHVRAIRKSVKRSERAAALRRRYPDLFE